ncbi:MAG: penicillin-binding protein 2 [Gammaproteobacteria bacterium]|nr:penicillin-binding protein 2 [Gammaproteobacteria bacterium]
MPRYRARTWTLLLLLGLAGTLLIWRAVHQQIFETDFLQDQGERRHLRGVEVPAHRGMITDRDGDPLAISTPADSVWANPRVLAPDSHTLAPLAKALDSSVEDLRQLLASRSDRSFVYLRRRLTPDLTNKINKLVREKAIPGVGLDRGFRRYYPGGEVFSHVVGFTDIDDTGQEGVELAYQQWLQSIPGKKLVIRDGHARAVQNIESIRAPVEGRDLALSLDRRLQYLAYRELKSAVKQHGAKAGSAIILDVRSGEILAMVNRPSYNPNGSKDVKRSYFRNRAVTDVFEPGSTMKPFTIAAGLETGRYRPDTRIDTNPGFITVGRNRVKDHHNLGVIDVTTVIQRSSNVGATKIAMDIPPETLWRFYDRLGFGSPTGVSFPGESDGQLTPYKRWADIDHATLAFGYGLSVTTLQLAQAYAVLAADGVKRPASLLRLDKPVQGEPVLAKETARAVRRMMETVVSPEGTAPQAAVIGYRVAGKTGTVRKSVPGGYSKDRYLSIFAGIAPASAPRLVMVVVIDEPKGKQYYGGQVAAPVFSRVMSGALRLLNITPDDLSPKDVRMAAVGGEG